MKDDVMKLSSNTLQQTIHSIDKFISKEIESLNEYKSKMTSISSLWSDASGYNQVIEFINDFVKKTVAELEETKNIYKKFLLEEIDDIRIKLIGMSK